MRVRTQSRADEILAVCDRHGWKVIVGLKPDEEEDVSDVQRLLHSPAPLRAVLATGRNDPCPCGSGRKYKQCCGSDSAASRR